MSKSSNKRKHTNGVALAHKRKHLNAVTIQFPNDVLAQAKLAALSDNTKNVLSKRDVEEATRERKVINIARRRQGEQQFIRRDVTTTIKKQKAS